MEREPKTRREQVEEAIRNTEGVLPDYLKGYQDAMVDLMTSGKLLGASACSLSISSAKLKQIVDDIDFFISVPI